MYNAKSAKDGSFALEGLAPGSYVLCAERADIALLNPCLWSATPTSVTITAGATATAPFTAERGVILRIRLNDPQGLLRSNPALDDVLVGAKPTTGPPMPARASKDGAGMLFTLLAPEAKPIEILIQSRKLALEDEKGNPFAAANSKLTVVAPIATASQAAQAAGVPDVILTIRGQASKP